MLALSVLAFFAFALTTFSLALALSSTDEVADAIGSSVSCSSSSGASRKSSKSGSDSASDGRLTNYSSDC